MASSVKLPEVNEFGYYEIRLESIGGLGANLCGKILGELGALYLELNCSSFASYGSEKKGSPVKSFIRWCDNDRIIRINSPIESPHLLGIFHDRMAGKDGVMAGVNERSRVVVNTDAEPSEIRDRLKMCAGSLHTIDALSIAIKKKTRINMVMLGALSRASGFIPLEAVLNAVTDTVGKKYPAALAGNLNGIREGYSSVSEMKISDNKYPYVEYKEPTLSWGYKNAPIGGVVPHYGSTISNDLSASREGFVPFFIKEKCINCGLCDTTCPDMVYQFQMGEYKGKKSPVNLGPDYHHCKGCMRCVEICPVSAIEAKNERDVDISEYHVRNLDLIVNKMAFESVGANSYVNAESELETKNIEVGEGDNSCQNHK